MISKWMLFYIGIRSLFLQALWNFERMQNVGFAFTIMPALKKLYPEKESYIKAIKRHLEFFNVHPYMIGIIVGVVTLFEEKMIKESKDYTKEIVTLKSTMAGPLAAIGDSFFWGLWRPFSAVVIITVFYLFSDKFYSNVHYFLLVIGFCVIYNIPHLLIRFGGIYKAYSVGTKVISFIRIWQDLDVYKYIRFLGGVLILVGFSGFILIREYSLMTIVKIVTIAIVFIALNRRKFSVNKILCYVLGILLILSYTVFKI